MEVMEEDEISVAPAAAGPQTRDQLILKEFIICLESMPEVWDSSDVNHKHKVKRAHAYEKLLDILKKMKENATIDDVRKKINSLRSNYRKEFKKIILSKRSGAGADEVYYPKSWVFHMLHFIGKVEQPVASTSATSENLQSMDIQDQDTSTLQCSKPMENIEESMTSASFSSINTVPPPSKKKKGPIAKQNELLEKACNYLAETQNNQMPNHIDYNPTALYWSQKLKKIHPDQMIHAEKAINDILYEATQGTLHKHSVKINVMPSPSHNSSQFHTTPSPRIVLSKLNQKPISPPAVITHPSNIIIRKKQLHIPASQDSDDNNYNVGSLFAQFKEEI